MEHLQSLRDFILMNKSDVFTAFANALIEGIFPKNGTYADFSDANMLNRCFRGCTAGSATSFSTSSMIRA